MKTGNSLLKSLSWEILFLTSFIVGFGIWSALQGQDINWDLKQYHFYNGYAYLHHRFDKDIGPAMVQTYINPFFDVINYLLISIQKPILTEFLLGAFSGLSAFMLYKISMLLFANVSRKERFIYVLFSLLIGMTGTNSISLLNTTTNDNKMGLLVIVSLYFLLTAVLSTKQTKIAYLFLAAFIAGLVAGLKLPAACYAIGLCMAALPLLSNIRLFLLFIFFMCAGFLLVNGYWMLFLYNHFQNPIFPYYNDIFRSPYAPLISFNLPAGQSNLSLYHYLLLPFYLAVKNDIASEHMRDLRLVTILLLGLGLIGRYIFYKRTRIDEAVTEEEKQIGLAWYVLFLFASLSYLVWLIMFTVYRYLLPLELIMGLLIIYMVRAMFARKILQGVLLVLLSCMFLFTTSYTDRNNKRTYHKEFFAISVPYLPANSTVLLTSVPLSFVIPFFPETIRFVGMPFVSLGIDAENKHAIENNKLLKEVMSKLSVEPIPLYTLSFQHSDRFDKKTKMILNHFGFIFNEWNCQFLYSNVGDDLKLCRIFRSWEKKSN